MGHIDICQRALRMFDQVVIGVADSLAKEPFFNIDERLEMLQIVFADNDRILVKPFSGLLIDFARECGAGRYRAWLARDLGFRVRSATGGYE